MGGGDPAACLAAHRASPNVPAYLCCVDPSSGFCEAALEYRPGGRVCSVDTMEGAGGVQCCYTDPSDGADPSAGGVGTAGGTAPPLAVECNAINKRQPCPGCTAVGLPACADRPVGCGSRAAAVYTRCDVQVCVAGPPNKAGRKYVRQTLCGWFGTPAQCCLRIKEWWKRAQCCRNCVVPGRRRSSFGCCYPGPRPW